MLLYCSTALLSRSLYVRCSRECSSAMLMLYETRYTPLLQQIMGSISKAIMTFKIFAALLIQLCNLTGACRTCLLVSPLNPTLTLSLAPMSMRSTTINKAPLCSRQFLKQSNVGDSTISLNMFHRDEDVGKGSNVTMSVIDDPLARTGSSNRDESDTSSAILLGSIKFYKNFISPVLPRACRFLPTCSTYGMEAIQHFGPTKGVILTAWRILRCSPFGGRGYDPPVWPPVPYNYKSY
jgi:putative membrane protein insertion efficiency factor